MPSRHHLDLGDCDRARPLVRGLDVATATHVTLARGTNAERGWRACGTSCPSPLEVRAFPLRRPRSLFCSTSAVPVPGRGALCLVSVRSHRFDGWPVFLTMTSPLLDDDSDCSSSSLLLLAALGTYPRLTSRGPSWP